MRGAPGTSGPRARQGSEMRTDAPTPDPAPRAQPPRRRLPYALVLSPLLVGNVLMLALCLLGFHMLSASRAYVGGQSLWSQARAQAFKHLRSYALNGSPQQLAQFHAALTVPLGDREARLALDREPLDRDYVSAALRRGGNAAEDIPGMIRLYRWFGRSELMQASVEAWRRADQHILELLAAAAQLQQRIESAGVAADPRPELTLAALDALETELQTLEQQFSQALGEASRATYQRLAGLLVLTALLLTLTAALMLRAGLRRQMRAEAALEDAHRRWTLAAASAGLGIFEWTLDDDRVLLDARACAIYGVRPDAEGLCELPRARLRALVPQEDVPVLQLSLDDAVQAGPTPAAAEPRLFRQRFRIRPEHGEVALRHLEVTGQVHGRPEAGERRKMVGVIRDISLQLQQEQLALDKVAAERSAAARMEFLSRLSHELRTPLNAVLGFSDLLLLGGPEALGPRPRRHVEMIQAAGKHLLRLVDDVLDISHIDAGHYQVARTPVPMAPVLAEAAALVSSELREHAIALELPPLPDPALAELQVLGDAQRLSQALANLLSNACKYNRPAGRVRVTVQGDAQWVRVAVEDQGPGLSEQDQALLFQPFKRLPGTARLPGSGLGLTIVKLLVEQMGGRVQVSSRLGEGSCFILELPRASSPAPAPERAV